MQDAVNLTHILWKTHNKSWTIFKNSIFCTLYCDTYFSQIWTIQWTPWTLCWASTRWSPYIVFVQKCIEPQLSDRKLVIQTLVSIHFLFNDCEKTLSSLIHKRKNERIILMWCGYEIMIIVKMLITHCKKNRWHESSWIKLKFWLVSLTSLTNPWLKICWDMSQEGLWWISNSSLKICPSCWCLTEKVHIKISWL